MGIPFKWQADQRLGVVPDDSFGAWLSNAPGGFVGVMGAPGQFPFTAFDYNGAGERGSGLAFGSAIQNLGQAHIDANDDGDWAFVWTERGPNGSDVYVGQFLGGPSRTLVAGGAGDQVDPSVAVGADGGFVVAYNDLSVSGGQLVIKVFDSNGVLLRTVPTADLTPGVSTTGPQVFRDISVGADDAGTYWVAWGDGSPQEIRLARMFNNGAGINDDFLISTPGETSAHPNLTVLESNLPFVTWVAGEGASTTVKAIILARSTPFVVFPDVTPDAGQQVSSAELTDGRIVVTAVGRDGDIIARLLNSDGSPATDVFVVNADTTAFCVRPVVVELDDGRFVITWEENQDGDEDLMFAIFDPREEASEMSGTDLADDFYGTVFADLYLMNDGDDVAHGDDGDDRLSGELGRDQLFGDAGNDSLKGGRGDDFLFGGAGADRLDGGDGLDTVSYADALAGISLTAGVGGLSGDAAGDIFVGIEAYAGSSFADVMTGSSAADAMNGGFGDDRLFGGAGDDVLDGGGGSDVVEGGAGADEMNAGSPFFSTGTLSYAGSNAAVTVNLTTRAASGGHAQGDTFEGFANLTGSAFGDSLTGNSDVNTLSGGGSADVLFGVGGNDTLDGGTGADVVTGGVNDDTYIVDDAGDVVVEALDEGVDRVLSSVTFDASGGSTAGLENVTLTGTASVNALGNGLANTLGGNTRNNTLDGRGGADHMTGGLGDDTYVIDNVGDVIVETTGQGNDTVRSSISFAFTGQSLENLILTGSANINATANSKANVLIGNSGNNILDGKTGADHMTGGKGDDTYIVDNVGDVIVEVTGEGLDTVRSSISFAFTGQSLENLILTGTSNINATANTKANILLGNSGSNILDGKTGADHMTGGKGDDTYIVDNVGDVIVEVTGEGTDTVRSSISFAFTGQSLENLILTGSGNINATANSKANILIGNSGNNILDGKTGIDTMTGGKGNDTYVVDSNSDVVIETKGEGTDLILSSVAFVMKTGSFVENLTLTGTSNTNATGNGVGNVLTGNAGSNVLDGAASTDTLIGGGGRDTLTGGTGADRFVFKALSDSVGATSDLITDLSNSDFIDLSAIDGNTSVRGVQGFTLVNAFSNAAGQMTLGFNAPNNTTTLNLDVNGDGAADMTIRITGDHDDFTNFIFGGG